MKVYKAIVASVSTYSIVIKIIQEKGKLKLQNYIEKKITKRVLIMLKVRILDLNCLVIEVKAGRGRTDEDGIDRRL